MRGQQKLDSSPRRNPRCHCFRHSTCGFCLCFSVFQCLCCVFAYCYCFYHCYTYCFVILIVIVLLLLLCCHTYCCYCFVIVLLIVLLFLLSLFSYSCCYCFVIVIEVYVIRSCIFSSSWMVALAPQSLWLKSECFFVFFKFFLKKLNQYFFEFDISKKHFFLTFAFKHTEGSVPTIGRPEVPQSTALTVLTFVIHHTKP